MEFPRRGRPATDDAGDGHRFPDPPSHGEEEPMLVMREALLSQLHMDRLRQEIIVADLAKIECDLAIRAAAGAHQATPMHGLAATDAGRSMPLPFSAEQPMGMRAASDSHRTTPMPWYGAADADAGRSKPWPFSVEQPMAMRAAAGGHQTTPVPFHGAAVADDERSKPWPFSAEQLIALRATAGGHQTTPMPSCSVAAADDGRSTPWPFSAEQLMALPTAADGHQATPMPWHGVAADNAGLSKPWSFSAEQPRDQQNAECDEHKLLDSNKVPQSKTSLVEKWELTGITIPAEKPKPPMKWNCTVCKVQATSEQNLQDHYAGQKHLANVATLHPKTRASDQMAKTAAEPSLGSGGEQKKTSSIKWSCSTCQASGTSKSTFDSHLQGKRHQQNISATPAEGNSNCAPKNVVAQEAKPHSSINVPKSSENPPSSWSCSICQAICTCESDLKNHLRGMRHREKVQPLLEESMKNMARNPEATKAELNPDSRWLCATCQAYCTSKSDLRNHLAGKRHQLNIQLEEVREKTKQEKNNTPQMVWQEKTNQEPLSAWNCTMCEAKCYSKSQFENHCSGSRHQQKIEAILGKRETAKASSSRTANELSSDGSSGESASSEKAEKKATLYYCEVCNVLCSNSTMLVSHRFGKRHREKLSAAK